MYVTIILKMYSVGPGASDCIAEDYDNSAIYVVLRFLLGYDETVVWIPCEKIEDL